MNKVKKGFYDVLWSMCEKENLLTRWILDGYLGKSKDTFYWTPKALAMFECEIVGEKTIEYRDITPYWSKRLENRHYDVIQFRNGYAKVAPTMVVEYKGMGIDDGRYAIELGNILESKNVT